MKIKVVLDEGAKMPTKAHRSDAGFDIYSPRTFNLYPGQSVVIDTGVHMAIPFGYVGFVKSKSGLYMASDITAEGVVDSGYTGAVHVKLCMSERAEKPKCFLAGDKITQIVILPVPDAELEESEALPFTDRGDGGFGSTGR